LFLYYWFLVKGFIFGVLTILESEMKNILAKSIAGLALVLAIGSQAFAQDSSINASVKVKDAALKANIIGETASGYLEFVRVPTPDQVDISRAINEINAARKRVYTTTAKERGTTIDAFALVSAYKQIKEKTQNGQYFRDTSGTWCLKTDKSIIDIKTDGAITIQCSTK
jgi:uncharacterized protein YdbL (DUF1318 family)